jgi:solute:Na+ symporter, SSS family
VRPRPPGRRVCSASPAVLVGVVVSVLTALPASQFGNIMNYLQALFSIFNAPVVATFILGMFWKRTSAWAASGAAHRCPQRQPVWPGDS